MASQATFGDSDQVEADSREIGIHTHGSNGGTHEVSALLSEKDARVGAEVTPEEAGGETLVVSPTVRVAEALVARVVEEPALNPAEEPRTEKEAEVEEPIQDKVGPGAEESIDAEKSNEGEVRAEKEPEAEGDAPAENKESAEDEATVEKEQSVRVLDVIDVSTRFTGSFLLRLGTYARMFPRGCIPQDVRVRTEWPAQSRSYRCRET